MKNLVRKIYPVSGITWTAPAGVREVTVTVLDRFDELVSGGVALKSNGSVWTWGINSSGQLGDGTIVNKSSPVQVIGGHSFIKIKNNVSQTTALKADGTVWSWGDNFSGQLGDGTVINKSSPVQVIGGHSFIGIFSGGNSYSAALKSDGSAWTWGVNTNGQLGDGTIINKSSPVQVIGGHSFIDISTGNDFALALKSDGTVWSWGNNSIGNLGNGNTTNTSSPVQVIGGHSFIQIAAGAYHGSALKSDGSVWTWGYNNIGQLGTGDIIDSSSPVAVVGGHSFIKINTFQSRVFALKSDGSAWNWGQNFLGSMGDGTASLSRSSPVAVIGGHSFIHISQTSNQVSIALKANGTAWAWGRNLSGELGDGTVVNKSSPVQVTGGHLFEAGTRFANKKVFTVTPGTTYNISSFFTSIGANTLISNAQNNSYVVLEYYG